MPRGPGSRERPTPGPTAGAIVLAGGRSSRFGRDKLEVELGGRRLLDRAIDAAKAALGRDAPIVVVTAPDAPARVLPAGVVATADPTPFQGPLAGVAAGLAALPPTVEPVLVVAGDMPAMRPAVLRRLLELLAAGADAAVLADADGRARPLPMACRSHAARTATEALLASGERRLGALPEALGAVIVEAPDWRALDPTGTTLRDVDTPADLDLALDDPVGG